MDPNKRIKAAHSASSSSPSSSNVSSSIPSGGGELALTICDNRAYQEDEGNAKTKYGKISAFVSFIETIVVFLNHFKSYLYLY